MAYDPNWIYVDGFAGGGGASTGMAWAIGRDPDVAINHSPTAIAIHKANHPDTEHHCQDIRALWPAQATKLRRVAGMWMSPDCKEYSKAKGAPLKNRHIRALSDEIDNWLRDERPLVAWVENVEEYETAGPLDENGFEIKELRGVPFKRRIRGWKRLGYKVEWRLLRACDYGAPTSRLRLYIVLRRDGLPIVWPEPTHGHPDSEAVRSGKLLPYRTAAECIDWSKPCPSIFDRKKELVEASNRRVAHGVMRHVVQAAKHGKLFLVPANDDLVAAHVTKFHSTNRTGSSITDAMPTVTANGQPARPAGAIPLGLAGATLAPFVSYGQHGGASRPANEPHHTIAASTKDTNGVVGATLIGVGGRRGQSPPKAMNGTYPTTTVKADAAIATANLVEAAFIDRQFGNSTGNAVDMPLGATTAGGGGKSAAVAAFLSSYNGSDKRGAAGDPLQPLPTIRTGGGKGGGHRAIVAAHIEQANGGPRNINAAGRAADRPLSTATATGSQQRIVETTLIEEGDLPPAMMERAVKVAAFLVKYYGEGGQHQRCDVPLDVVTTKARYAVVTVTIDAKTYVIVDIGLRMLTPRELANAQGFPPDYVLDPIVRKFLRGKWVERRLTIAEQISAIGNSVCPPVAYALVAANQPNIDFEERLAA